MATKIEELEDVKRFAKHLVNDLHLNFQPGDYFSCFKQPTFSTAKAVYYNVLMNESLDTCEREGVDIYEI